jgi:hypothetical protein
MLRFGISMKMVDPVEGRNVFQPIVTETVAFYWLFRH